MWSASDVVHLRKVHWRVAAVWLYGHLLDGDLASNHLSWQWVAGTGSRKPCLFNADNVARYAPAAWHSPGSVIDRSYEALDAIARQAPALVRAADDASAVESARLEPPLRLAVERSASAFCRASHGRTRLAPLARGCGVHRRCDSFSQWWNRASRGVGDAAELLTV